MGRNGFIEMVMSSHGNTVFLFKEYDSLNISYAGYGHSVALLRHSIILSWPFHVIAENLIFRRDVSTFKNEITWSVCETTW